MPVAARRRAWWRLGLMLLALAALVAAANVPLTTRQGVNYVVTPRVVPAYVKTLDFVDRNANYNGLARQITEGASSDEARLRAVFMWTRTNIHDTPAGFPVVDDHVWHIIIRGYGQDDQKADVFTTLLAYAGVPAYWIFIGPGPELTLSLVEIEGRWRGVDVANGIMFKAPDGQLATADELGADHRLAAAQGPSRYRDVEYIRYFDHFQAPRPPDITRPEMQMVWPRVRYELRALLGRRGGSWEMRPASRQRPE